MLEFSMDQLGLATTLIGMILAIHWFRVYFLNLYRADRVLRFLLAGIVIMVALVVLMANLLARANVVPNFSGGTAGALLVAAAWLLSMRTARQDRK